MMSREKSYEELFTRRLWSRRIRHRLIRDNLIPYECAKCGIDSWRGMPLALDVDHIDGDKENNHLDNLRFLCPNCHSQTETYCGKNKRRKYLARVAERQTREA